ncbi:uncharacterized protein [Amphiura filiformis]|uniref:uncharacterized protein n=1 Tax=Amphiura filiformis TaxID=82378 RepID=UPI003B21D630
MDNPSPTPPPSELDLALIIGASTAGLVVLLILIYIVYRCRRKKDSGQKNQLVANDTKAKQKQGQSNPGYEEVDETNNKPKRLDENSVTKTVSNSPNKQHGGKGGDKTSMQMKGLEPTTNGISNDMKQRTTVTVEINSEFNNNSLSKGGTKKKNTADDIANGSIRANFTTATENNHIENGMVPLENPTVQEEDIVKIGDEDIGSDDVQVESAPASSDNGVPESSSPIKNEETQPSQNDDDSEHKLPHEEIGSAESSQKHATDASPPNAPEEEVKDEDGDEDSKQDEDKTGHGIPPPEPEMAPNGATSLVGEQDADNHHQKEDCEDIPESVKAHLSQLKSEDKRKYYEAKLDEDTGEVTCEVKRACLLALKRGETCCDDDDDTQQAISVSGEEDGSMKAESSASGDDGRSDEQQETSVKDEGKSYIETSPNDDKPSSHSNEDVSSKEKSQDEKESNDELPQANGTVIENLKSEESKKGDESVESKSSIDNPVIQQVDQEESDKLKEDRNQDSEEVVSAEPKPSHDSIQNQKSEIETKVDQKKDVNMQSEYPVDKVSDGQDSVHVQKSETSDSSSPKVEQNDLQNTASSGNVLDTKRLQSPQKDNKKTRNALKGTDSKQEDKKPDRMSQTIAMLEKIQQEKLVAIQHVSKPKPKPPVQVNKTPAPQPADIVRYSPPKRRVNTDHWPPQRASLSPNEGTARFSMEEELQHRLKAPGGAGLKSSGGVNRHKGPVMRKSYGGSQN